MIELQEPSDQLGALLFFASPHIIPHYFIKNTSSRYSAYFGHSKALNGRIVELPLIEQCFCTVQKMNFIPGYSIA